MVTGMQTSPVPLLITPGSPWYHFTIERLERPADRAT
jgi:hypothetical protein